MKKLLLAFLMISMIGLSELIAQHTGHWCGTSEEDQIAMRDWINHNRDKLGTQERTGIMWTPIKFHIVGNDSGGDRVDVMRIFDVLCNLNEDYLDQDIQFFIQGEYNFINSNLINENPSTGISSAAMQGHKSNSAINIFIVKNIPGVNTSGGGGIGGYYSTPNDFIVLPRTNIGATPNSAGAITHEVGHYFNLPHPFLGWNESYDPVIHGNPVQSTAGGTNSPTELVSGANCTVAGDGICDTPPDYLFGPNWSGCNYNAGTMDPQGVIVDPLEDNIMSYFDYACYAGFTPDQKDVIAARLAQRTNLHTNIDPDTSPMEAPTLNYPINNEETPAYQTIGFDWEPVPGAEMYIVEVDKTSNFAFSPSVKFTTGTYVEFSDVFTPGSFYYWRVKALKKGNYCAPTSDIPTSKFKAGLNATATNEIEEVLNYNISPNPLNGGDVLNINIEASQAFDAKINLFSLSGQKIQEVNQRFGLGNANYELSVRDLAQGMYILSIETESGVLNEKIVVTR